MKQNHAVNSKSRLKTDEQKVQVIIACLLEWDVNPWNKDMNILRSFESGFLASTVLIADFNSAKNDGEIQIVKHFEERIKSSEKLITPTIPRNKRYTFQMPEVGHECKAPKRTDAMESKALTALIQAAQKSAIDLEQVMKYRVRKYRVRDISLPLFNLDGTIRKAMKSKLQECLYFVSENLHSNIAIIGMGLLWRAALPTKEDREAPGGSQLIWKWYPEKMFRLILERYPNAEEIHLINDRYDVDLSIKKC